MKSIKKYVNKNIHKNINLNNLKIMMMFEKSNDIQVHIEFSSLLSYSLTSISSMVKYFEKYYVITKEEHNVSLFGNYRNIISTIIHNNYKKFINKYRNVKENVLLKIIIKKQNHNDQSNIFNKKNTLLINNSNENENSTYVQCPICITDYNNVNHKITLQCNHCICIKCLYTLISNDEINCPVCRKKIIM